MKSFTLALLFLLSVCNSNAQFLSGTAKDATTQQPITGVQVITKKGTIVTDGNGLFKLADQQVGDRISFRIMGYETKEFQVNAQNINTTITVCLKTLAIDLREVNIRAPRNLQKDSLMRRTAYAAVFNSQQPTIKDLFVSINPEEKVPLALVKPPSTSSIATINVLQVMSLFGKKKARTTKLKSTLLADEAADYVNRRFSEAKVAGITNLKADSLKLFVQKFKPTASEMKTMNDYQLSIYIKDKYLEFIKP